MRNSNIEILRFSLMAAIFIWHVFCHGYEFCDGLLGMSTYGNTLPLALFICAVTCPASYCFFFITGYYGVRFSSKKIIAIFSWMISASLLGVLYKYFFLHQFVPYEIYSSLLPFHLDRWWFMTCYLILFLLSPFINKALPLLEKKELRLIFLTIYGILLYRFVLLVPNAGSNILGGVLLYILGRYMGLNKIAFRKVVSVRIFIICAVVLTIMSSISFYGLESISPKFAQRVAFQWFSYENPLVIMMALSLFFYVKSFPPFTNNYLNRILSTNIFIYLITSSVGIIDYKVFASLMDNNLLYFCLAVIIVLIGCLLAGHIITIMCNALIKCLLLLWKYVYVLLLRIPAAYDRYLSDNC